MSVALWSAADATCGGVIAQAPIESARAPTLMHCLIDIHICASKNVIKFMQ
jgi:hypothetical protein